MTTYGTASLSEYSLLTEKTQESGDGTTNLSLTVSGSVVENTQRVIDLYRSGAKLWTKSDLERIEHELANFKTTPTFNVRRIDGTMDSVKNSMFGVENLLWKPFITFQHYWYMVGTSYARTSSIRSAIPQSFPYYSYYITWENQAFIEFVAGEDTTLEAKFEDARKKWESSQTCNWLKRKLAILQGGRKVTKLICFGLGTMEPRSQLDSRGSSSKYERDRFKYQRSSMNQHALALTIAETLGKDVPVLAQDPTYTMESRDVLKNNGITTVRDHGAGRSAMVDDESAVLFCYPSCLVRQLMADLARPALIVGNEGGTVMNDDQDVLFPYDAAFPRTREMFEGYTEHNFETMEPDKMREGIVDFRIWVRNDVNGASTQVMAWLGEKGESE
ncbi:uncharacterized protein F4822DRAFT_295253 [Hypoxylon trugodes]|uniref:uncharacterized protein n=1 Tax=Hypoxylon trugodes TaxID=326681 RepID=UPI0021A0FD8D|nr:uncharacterized protein F4822DRAFT_295253 [Hypoxylon trugodes]KAI1387889.1 hypothetical protein F4822DRAFT_295253 [Hypoxylon trugodes]